jgi:hydroxypyruvate isomerase
MSKVSMPKFAANLTLMYNEHDSLERFSASAKDGFKGGEFLFPYGFAAHEIQSRLIENNLTPVLFNLPPEDWNIGERGIASLPGREEEFKHSVEQALDYARILGNARLHVMAGVIQSGQDRERHRAVYLSNLSYAAQQAAMHGITLLIESINTRDIPGYFLNRQDEAQAICREVGASNLKVQFDIYHCQIVEGDVATKMRRDMNSIGHMQIAGVPERHEPDSGELNYSYLFHLMDELQYDGWVGCGYRPKSGTSSGLGWMQKWF